MKFEATVELSVEANNETEAIEKINDTLFAVREIEEFQIVEGPNEVADEDEDEELPEEEEDLDPSLDPEETE